MGPSKKKIKHQSPLTAQATDSISAGASKSKPKKKSKDHKPMSKKAQKRAEKEALEKAEEERLTAMLFGGGVVNNDADSVGSADSESSKEDGFEMESNYIEDEEGGELAFEIDRGGDASGDDDEASAEGELAQAWNDEDDDDDAVDHSVDMNDDDDSEANEEEESAPAWEDRDDAKTALVDGNSRLKKLRRTRDEKDALSSHELEQRLRQRYETSSQSTARTDWATKSKKQKTVEDEDEEDTDDAALSLFSTSKSLLASSRNQLPPNVLDIVRCPDANLVDPNKAVVRCIDFHPGSEPDQPLMLTAGLDKTLRFFQVGEEKSEKIHGIHCKCAHCTDCLRNSYDLENKYTQILLIFH